MSTNLNASTHATYARHAAPLDAAGQRSTPVRFSAAAMLDAVARLSDTDLLEQVSASPPASARPPPPSSPTSPSSLPVASTWPAGCASLFTYCTEVLRLSEHAAYHRIQAAAARRFPFLFDLLASGALTLTTVTLLAPPPHPGQPPEGPAGGRGSVEAGGGGAGGHAPPPAAGAHGPAATAGATVNGLGDVPGRGASPSDAGARRGDHAEGPTLQR